MQLESDFTSISLVIPDDMSIDRDRIFETPVRVSTAEKTILHNPSVQSTISVIRLSVSFCSSSRSQKLRGPPSRLPTLADVTPAFPVPGAERWGTLLPSWLVSGPSDADLLKHSGTDLGTQHLIAA